MTVDPYLAPSGRTVGRMDRACAAWLAVALVFSACTDDEGSSSGKPASTETSRSSTASSVPVVLTSADGVVIAAGGDEIQVSPSPAAGAYGIGTDLVVFQDALSDSPGYPPDAVGRVRAWSAGEVRELPTDPAATRDLLLDARVVDGVPVALVAHRFDGAGPDDTFEELVQIDLRDDTSTTIMRRRPAWEWGHRAARFLPDGDIVGLIGSSAQLLVGRWTASADEPLWMVEVGLDTSLDLVVRDTEVSVVQIVRDAERGFISALLLTRHDPATGAPSSTGTFRIADPEGELDTGLFCREWLAPGELACSRSGGPPVAVALDPGTFSTLPGGPGALPTVIRTR